MPRADVARIRADAERAQRTGDSAYPVEDVPALCDRIEELEREADEAFNSGRAQGRKDIDKYSAALDAIESLLGLPAAPMTSTVDAARRMKVRVEKLEAVERAARAYVEAIDELSKVSEESGIDRGVIERKDRAWDAAKRATDALRAALAATADAAPAPDAPDAREEPERTKALLRTAFERAKTAEPWICHVCGNENLARSTDCMWCGNARREEQER